MGWRSPVQFHSLGTMWCHRVSFVTECLKLDHPRQMALMHALVRFAHVAAGSTFTTGEVYPYVVEALGCSTSTYSLASDPRAEKYKCTELASASVVFARASTPRSLRG